MSRTWQTHAATCTTTTSGPRAGLRWRARATDKTGLIRRVELLCELRGRYPDVHLGPTWSPHGHLCLTARLCARAA
eukprot:4384241-Lingulodinium_polyedra.AAC.1